MKNKKKSVVAKIKVAGRIAALILVTLLLVAVALYGVMLILTRGPSETTKKLFVMSVKETSAGGFLAHMCLPREEIDAIMAEKQAAIDLGQSGTTDKGLINIEGGKTNETTAPEQTTDETAQIPDEGVCDPAPEIDDTDDIEIVEISGGTYNGVMMIVKDPRRVFIGIPDEYGEDEHGLSLKALIDKYDAVGGTNAGGFIDPGGMGTGGMPLGPVIKDGEVIWGDGNSSASMIGFDADGILHVGTMTPNGAISAGVREAVSFGPALIINGKPCNSTGDLSGGLNPRTAIGQRSDGAMLLLVVNGRSIGSLGATLDDLVDIMITYGAVNAANLDGGASSLMMYDGETMNDSAYVYGERVLPNAILVRK